MAGWAQAIGAGTSLLGSIIGGSQARGAVKRAGTVLKNAAEGETDRIYQKLMETNPQLADAYLQARQSVTSTADYTSEGPQQAAERGNALLDPYMQAGGRSANTLADLVNAPEERVAFPFSEGDRSYRLRLSEGQKALERSAAARGTLLGGGTLKAITNYGQKAASQEYQSAYDRAMSAFKANQQGRQTRLSSLADLARMGGPPAERAGLNLTGAATTAGGWRNKAAELEGAWGISSAQDQVRNTLAAEENARRMRLGGAQAEAGSIYGAGQITGNMWSQGGQALGDFISMNPFKRQQQPGAPSGGMGSYSW